MSDAPPPPSTPGLVRVGEFNEVHVFVGARKAGKTTDACRLARELRARAGGAYIIGHSVGHRLPTHLPDGTALPIVYHRSTTDIEASIRREWPRLSTPAGPVRGPDAWHIVAPPLPDADPYPHLPRSSADDVIHWTISFAARIKQAAWLKRHPFRFRVPERGVTYTGLACPPVILMLDEGTAVAAARKGNSDEQDWFRAALTAVRHEHIGLIVSVQSMNMRSHFIAQQATQVHAFQTRHRYELDALVAAGMEPDDIEAVRTLPRFKSHTFTSEAVDESDPPAA